MAFNSLHVRKREHFVTDLIHIKLHFKVLLHEMKRSIRRKKTFMHLFLDYTVIPFSQQLPNIK